MAETTELMSAGHLQCKDDEDDEVERKQGGEYIFKIMSHHTIFGWLFRRKAMAFAGLELDADNPGFVYNVAS